MGYSFDEDWRPTNGNSVILAVTGEIKIYIYHRREKERYFEGW